MTASIAQTIRSMNEADLVSMLQEIIAGRIIDTGRLRLADFIWREAKSTENGLGTIPLCSAVMKVLNHTNFEYFIKFAEDKSVGYLIQEIFTLASQTQSPGVARILARKRILSRSKGLQKEYDRLFSDHLVRATRECCHDYEVANQAVILCEDEAYQKYIAPLYFGLLELSPDKSIEAAPYFVDHYFSISDETVRNVYHKNLQYFFSNGDLGSYIDRLSHNVGKTFWSIVIQTDLSKRLFTIPVEPEVAILDSEMPTNQLVVGGGQKNRFFKATNDANDIKILSAQVAEAASNPQLVQQRFKELLNWTQTSEAANG